MELVYFLSFSEGKHENHTFKSLVFLLSVSLYAHSLADVLSREDHVAGPTPEAADVPLFLQRQERLTLLDLISTTRTVWRREGRNKKKKSSREWQDGKDIKNNVNGDVIVHL